MSKSKPKPKPKPESESHSVDPALQRSQRPRIRGGTAFDPDELEAAVAARPKGLKKKNGAAVVDSRQREIALKHLSALSRAMYELGLFDEFNASLSQMIRRVKTLR